MILSPSSVFFPAPAGGHFAGSATLTGTFSFANCSTLLYSTWFKGSVTGVNHKLFQFYNAGTGSGIIELGLNPATNSYFTFGAIKPGSSPVVRHSYNSPVSTFSIGDGKWHHVILSWDANAPTLQIYLDDTIYNIGSVTTDAIGNSTAPDSLILRHYNSDLSETYLNPNTTLDLSITANRRKFISATKRPIFLGSNGSLPTGSQPQIYLKGLGTGFNVNSGSLGNFTTTGTLTTPTTTPSAP